MPSKLPILIISIFILSLTSCKQENNTPQSSIKNSEAYSADFQTELQERFNKKDTSFEINASEFEYYDTLKYFYSNRKFQPLFIKDSETKSFLDSIMELFSKSGEQGLQSSRYHVDLIKNEIGKILSSSDYKNKHLANTEVLLADAILKYACHLRYGVVDPHKIFPESYSFAAPDSGKRDILKPLYQENVFEYLKGIQPKNPQYKKLQSALVFFKKFQDSLWEKIESPSQVDLIAERLSVLSFIDSTKINIHDLNGKDSVFIKSVTEFQNANGFIGDGKIGKPTLEKLNITPSAYIEKIELNMERFRWNNYSDSTRYLLVNIPDFYLHVFENGQDIFDIRVCTGRKRPANYEERVKNYLKTRKHKPDDWQTPQLSSRISYLVLNPTWTVPPSIIKEEILRETRKDSTYLKKKNFKVFRNGKSVNLDRVDLTKFSPNNIPYSIVQDPGAGNALGKIKFMFANKYGVYLHDTPTRGPFSRSLRAVSHGCVRVEKPFQLAEFLLNNNSKWTLDYIKIETGNAVADQTKVVEFKQKRSELRRNSSYGKTTVVRFDHSIPVFLDYYTSWVDNRGIVNFRNDVYDKDKILKKYLFETESN
jgi:L,D-transpeptidase YcbB